MLYLCVAAGAHLPSHWPLSLWWKLIHYAETQGHCDIQLPTIYLPQVSLGTHRERQLYLANVLDYLILTQEEQDEQKQEHLEI